MSSQHSDKDELFGRSVDDFLLYEGVMFSDKEAHEFDDYYVVEISVPGFKNENLDLVADNDTLILRGYDITKQQSFFYTRITKNPIFQRSLVLPIDVAPNTISAEYKPGVVIITCPKQMIPHDHNRQHYLVQKRKIKIKSSGDNNSFLQQLKNLFKRS